MGIDPGARLLFIGDSVTDCGRLMPVGRGPAPALGSGYVARVDAELRSLRSGPRAEVINMGISGNTVRDLAARWERDVIALRPSWLCVLIGTNDVWRQFDGRNPPAAVPPDEFARTYDSLLARTRTQVDELVLMTPFYVQDDRKDPMRRRMDEYGAMVLDAARRHGAAGVDLQLAFDSALEWTGFASLAGDRVHPTEEGHTLIAKAFLAALGP